MGSHHAPGDDRYPQQRREPDPGSPYGRPAPEGRGGYAGAPTNPYAQQQPPQPPTPPQAGRHGEDPYGGGYRQQQPPQPPAEAPRRRRRYAEETPERAYEPAPAPSYEPARPSYDPAPPSYEPEPPAPVWADAPAAPAPRYDAADDDRASSWNDDQATQVYSHLGYVPREERRRRPADDEVSFGSEPPADDKRFKSMRRARRASGKAKAFMVIGVVVALALIGGGVWYLVNSGDDGRADTGGAYAALEKPCSVLDLAAVSDMGLTEDQTRHRESSEPKSDGGAAQTCAISLTGADGLGVDVGFEARVFDAPAKARNDWEFKMDAQKTKGGNGWKLTELGGEPGTQAFSLLQSWNADTASADYRLIFWHENVSVESRLTILKQSQVDENDLAKRAMDLAKAYMAKWAA